MKPPIDEAAEHILQRHILSLFALPDGGVTWQGYSELNTQSFVYYFSIGSENYLLANESFHGAGDNALNNLLIGNAVAPHQKLAQIQPKEGVRNYVNVADDKAAPLLKGDFSVFRIIG